MREKILNANREGYNFRDPITHKYYNGIMSNYEDLSPFRELSLQPIVSIRYIQKYTDPHGGEGVGFKKRIMNDPDNFYVTMVDIDSYNDGPMKLEDILYNMDWKGKRWYCRKFIKECQTYDLQVQKTT